MTVEAAEHPGIPPLTLGWRLQMALRHANVSVQEMADELGMSRTSLSGWLNDRSQPRIGFLRLWAMRTGVPLEWLTHGTAPETPVRRAGAGGEAATFMLGAPSGTRTPNPLI